MKLAFSILPENIAPDPNLLIELGSYGVSLMLYKARPFSLESVVTYNFSAAEGEDGGVLEEILKRHNHFNNPGQVTVCYNYNEVLLVPDKFYNPANNSAILDSMFGNPAGTITRADEIKTNEDADLRSSLHCVYRVPVSVSDVLNRYYPEAATWHSNSLQLACDETSIIKCIVYHDVIKILAYHNGKVLLVNQYHYTQAGEVAYVLLNICEHHQLDPSGVIIRISGMIDVNSILYQEIYRYFLNVEFSATEGASISQGELELPGHYFEHLIALAKCVS